MEEYGRLLNPLEKEANAKGVTAFSMIGTMTPADPNSKIKRERQGTLNLIQKIDNKFLNNLKKAKDDSNMEFIKDNISVAAYNIYAGKEIKKREKSIRAQIWNPNDKANNDLIMDRRLTNMRDTIDINRSTFRGYNDYFFSNTVMKVLNQEENLSKDYMEMSKSKAALEVWEYFTALNLQAKDSGYLKQKGASFFPLMEATILQKFSATEDVGAETIDFFKDIWTERINERKAHGKINPETGEIRKEVPTYFTQADKNVTQLSQDLNKIGHLWTKALMDYESNQNIESILLTLNTVELNKGNLITDEKGHLVRKSGKFVSSSESKNAAILETIINDAIYGITEEAGGVADAAVSSLAAIGSKGKEDQDDRAVNIKKLIESSNIVVRNLGVGLKYMITAANWMGQQFLAHILSGGVYTASEYKKNYIKMISNNLSEEERAVLDMVVPLNEDVTMESRRREGWKLSFKDYINTWAFSDVMQVSNSFPERGLQFNNALSFINNTMILDDKLVNIREHIRALDRAARVGMTQEGRNELNKSFEERVLAMKETSAITKFVEITEHGATLPGISDKVLAEFRVKVQDFSRKLNGQMNENDKAGFKRNIMGRSFMMFRTWIPKLLSERIIDINYNDKQDNWEYGRARLYVTTLQKVGLQNIFRMKHILMNTPEGLAMIEELLEAKKVSYLNKTGQILKITEEEFYDLINQELSSMVKELRILVSLVAMLAAGKVAEPPEDLTRAERNMYNSLFKQFNKISDEIIFFYDPTTFASISKGNVLPALSLITSVSKAFGHLSMETYGRFINDKDMIEENHPVKYFMNIIPGLYQYQTDIEPHLFPEYSKEKGVIVTKETRRN